MNKGKDKLQEPKKLRNYLIKSKSREVEALETKILVKIHPSNARGARTFIDVKSDNMIFISYRVISSLRI